MMTATAFRKNGNFAVLQEIGGTCVDAKSRTIVATFVVSGDGTTA